MPFGPSGCPVLMSPSNLAQLAPLWSQVAPGPEPQGVQLLLPKEETRPLSSRVTHPNLNRPLLCLSGRWKPVILWTVSDPHGVTFEGSLYANLWKLFSKRFTRRGEVPKSCLVAIILRFLQSSVDGGSFSRARESRPPDSGWTPVKTDFLIELWMWFYTLTGLWSCLHLVM